MKTEMYLRISGVRSSLSFMILQAEKLRMRRWSVRTGTVTARWQACLRDGTWDTLICGGIGAGAQSALMEAGIRFYGGVSGSADEAVQALLAGTLTYNADVHCEHQGHGDHEEGDSCGSDRHGCPGSEKF